MKIKVALANSKKCNINNQSWFCSIWETDEEKQMIQMYFIICKYVKLKGKVYVSVSSKLKENTKFVI